jgi:adenosylmethionine---8-amino-7-oxononanoate aminotransferase
MGCANSSICHLCRVKLIGWQVYLSNQNPELLSLEESPFWHPYTGVPHLGPRRMIVRAEGAYLVEASGHRLFDATSSWWCQLHGHCHPRLVAALVKQSQLLDQVLVAPHTHPTAEALSAELVRVAGSPFSKVFFSDNGSTAVEVAMKMALQYWKLSGHSQKTKFLSLDRGYHGDTLGAMAVASPKDFSWAFPQIESWSIQAPSPYFYRTPKGDTYESSARACADVAVRLIEEHAAELAAFVVEPLVLGAGGLVTYPPEYLERVVSAAHEHGVLVIFDEVFTAFGRTGTLFAFEQIKSRPDIVCLSKGLTSGMLALGATLATDKIFKAFIGGEERRLAHGHTFTANGLACSVALESLKMFRDEAVLERNQKLIEVMARQKLRFESLAHVGEVRHLGMIWAVELVRDKNTRELFSPANKLGWEICEKMWARGVWMRPMRQALYIIPPYCASPAELQDCFSQLEEVLSEYE